MYWLGEPFLYLSYALVVGWLIMIRTGESDVIARVPKWLIIASVVGAAVFSFLPVLRIVMFFSDDLGFLLTLKSVMFSFSEGKDYWWTLVLMSALLLLIIFADPRYNKTVWLLCFILTVLAMIMMALSSHINALYGSIGTVSQFLHFFSVTVWAGSLILVGWFKPKASSWLKFLSWFHLTAVLAMVIIIASGFFLTVSVAPEYINSWILPYGQALLLKHLFMIPLFVFALFNGFLIKRILKKNASFNPRPWAKAESVMILLIYTVTGFMNQQSAPHNVSETINETPPSKLFLWFHNQVTSGLHLTWKPSVVLALVLAMTCLGFMFLLFRKQKSAYAALAVSIIFVIISYLGAMFFVD
ncbi:copper resistance D family protein [Paenibacillus sp. XY044]|uniref:copper resistance D family protein n=1 Tax=Paenibacillus sp. XY044 TaxID=2026089 RepID=UPI000B995B8D|nr:CopD family protein [Paenibacillus sp. XY044]OZB91302.1 hypothetical protein CJP46_28870 [Paenibacillus sp. XY044]